jgi:hypothetical protein
MAASTTTTAEFSAAIDRIRQRIGTARSNPTSRERLRAAKPGGRSFAVSNFGSPGTNSPHPGIGRFQANEFKRLEAVGLEAAVVLGIGAARLA